MARSGKAWAKREQQLRLGRFFRTLHQLAEQASTDHTVDLSALGFAPWGDRSYGEQVRFLRETTSQRDLIQQFHRGMRALDKLEHNSPEFDLLCDLLDVISDSISSDPQP